ncbi:MAG: ABC transporter ATP-binding protein [Clostridia bacterium]|nr:ABC transporter ATP-binding protein [Clostridia bacterium]
MTEKTDKEKTGRPFSRLAGFMKPYRVKLIIAFVLILLDVTAYSLAPLFLGYAIDSLGRILTHTDLPLENGIFFVCLLEMVAAYGLSALFCYIDGRLLSSVAENTVHDLREAISRKLDRLPLNYYDSHPYGDILSRVTNDIDLIASALQVSIGQVLRSVFTVLILLVTMLFINVPLTLIGLATIPVCLFVAAKIAGKSQTEFDRQQEQTGTLNGYVEEYYTGQNVVAVCGREDTVTETFERINDELFGSSRRGAFLADVLTPVVEGTANIGYMLVCFAGALMAIAGGLSVGMIQAFTQYLSQFTMAIAETASVAGILQSTASASGRVFEFLDEPEESGDPEPGAFPARVRGRVRFDHVCFGYTPQQTLIHDLNVTVEPGEKIAIVGPTGAGKTTLVNLIMRFYDVRGGAILIDGTDIREMKRERLRELFGMVLQETWLFSGTIMENIRYGKPDATDEEVEAAARKAHADAFIRTLPDGYQFTLQEGAENIAQGQRQLLTIARAILSDAPIMILDEATSSVDTRTEVLIQEAMAEVIKGHTSFVIAHRLSTIRDASRIMYMQNGDILEIGSHEELMKKNGLYANLYRSQFSENNE